MSLKIMACFGFLADLTEPQLSAPEIGCPFLDTARHGARCRLLRWPCFVCNVRKWTMSFMNGHLISAAYSLRKCKAVVLRHIIQLRIWCQSCIWHQLLNRPWLGCSGSWRQARDERIHSGLSLRPAAAGKVAYVRDDCLVESSARYCGERYRVWVLNALLLRSLDVPQPGGLYNIVHAAHGYDYQSYRAYVDFKTRNTTFSDMAAYRLERAGLSTMHASSSCWFYKVSGNYFDILGVQPVQGRVFHPRDEHGPNSAPYVVLSYDFWRSRFESDPVIVGRTVEIDKHAFAVIGIAPSGFHGTDLFNLAGFLDHPLHLRGERG